MPPSFDCAPPMAAGRPVGSGIELVSQGDRLLEQRDHPVGRTAVEEVLVAHAPHDDARVIAMDADHLGEAREDVGVERVEVAGACSG